MSKTSREAQAKELKRQQDVCHSLKNRVRGLSDEAHWLRSALLAVLLSEDRAAAEEAAWGWLEEFQRLSKYGYLNREAMTVRWLIKHEPHRTPEQEAKPA